MDTTAVISDVLDNQNFNVDAFGDLLLMVDDYKYQLLMNELNAELNS